MLLRLLVKLPKTGIHNQHDFKFVLLNAKVDGYIKVLTKYASKNLSRRYGEDISEETFEAELEKLRCQPKPKKVEDFYSPNQGSCLYLEADLFLC